MGKKLRLLMLSVFIAVGISAAVPFTGLAKTTVPPTPPAIPAPAAQHGGLWVGELTRATTVRSSPGGAAVKGWWVGRRMLLYQTVSDARGGAWYRVSAPPEGPMYVPAASVRYVMPVRFQPALFAGRWVDVNISQQVVTAYQGGVPVLVTLASTGTAKHPTNLGMQRIQWRFPSREMIGGSKATGDYYDLKNVPYPQYFNGTGEALHGTYWHDDFGRPHSHGCVNLSTPIAGWFYSWANVGTPVYVHN